MRIKIGVCVGLVFSIIGAFAATGMAAGAVDEVFSYLRVDPSFSGKVPADGATACRITIFVKDTNNRAVSGKKVIAVTSRGTEFDVVSFPKGNTTDGEGVCEVEIKSKKAGGTDVTAFCEGITITENILNDGSFEEGEEGPPATWAAQGASWEVQSEVKYHGKKSLYYINEGEGDHYVDALWPDVTPVNFYPVSENTPYRVTMYAKSEGATAGVRPVWFKGDAPSYGGYLTEGAYGTVKGKKDWTPVSVRINAPKEATYLVFRCNTSNSKGEAWFDCVRLQRVPTLDFIAK